MTADLIVDFRSDRRPIVVTPAQQEGIRVMFADGAHDSEIAAAVGLPPYTISHIRAKMRLMRYAPSGGWDSAGQPKNRDGLPRMIVSDETLTRAYAGRKYFAHSKAG